MQTILAHGSPCPECGHPLCSISPPDCESWLLCDACDWTEGDEMPIRPRPFDHGFPKRFRFETEANAAAARVRGYRTEAKYDGWGTWIVRLYSGDRQVGSLTEADIVRAESALPSTTSTKAA